MSAHFQIIPTAGAAPTPAARPEKAGDGGDIFASLIDTATAVAPASATESVSAADAAPDAVATDFRDALKELQDALSSGAAPDQSLLDRLASDADDLGDEINGGGDHSDTLVQSLAAAAGLATAILAPALTPVVAAGAKLVEAITGPPEAPPPSRELTALGDKLKTLAGRLGAGDGELAAKLSVLADQLTSGKLSQATIDKLGLTAPDPATQDALQALLSPKSAPVPATRTDTVSISFPAPQLAAPAVPSVEPPPPADEPGAPVPVRKAGATAPVQVPPQESQPKPQDSSAAPAFTVDGGTDAADSTAPAQAPASAPAATTQATAAPRVLPAAYPTPQVNLPQVAFEIARQVQNGSSRFEIRLDPAELGRIDVRMHVDGAGNVHARLTVERSETLDLFQRDQRGLERALQQAGVDSGKTSLEFSLRQGPYDRPQQGFGAPAVALGFSATADAEPVAPSITLYRGTASPGGVNIFV